MAAQREDIWLTSKLWSAFHDSNKVEVALNKSLSNLGTDYLDLYSINWPITFRGDKKTKNSKPVVEERLTADHYPTWQKIEEIVKKGKVRNIGVKK
jgi:diketogulonate reductase-like aldo/keto reductase